MLQSAIRSSSFAVRKIHMFAGSAHRAATARSARPGSLCLTSIVIMIIVTIIMVIIVIIVITIITIIITSITGFRGTFFYGSL